MQKLTTLVDQKNWPQALVHALDLWRTNKDPLLADLIDVLESRCAPEIPHTRNKAAFEQQWHELAERDDPQLFGHLARTFYTRVQLDQSERTIVTRFRRKYAQLLDRMDRLFALADDPRVSSGLLDFVEAAPHTSGYSNSDELFGPALEKLVQIGDVRAVVRLQALIHAPTARLRMVRTSIAAGAQRTLDAMPAPGDALDISSLQHLLPRQHASDAPSILAEIYAHPDDLELRHVYADILQAQGDPRGEFVALQLRGETGSTLLRKHRREWLGPRVTRMLTQMTFRDGFPYAANTGGNATGEPTEWETLHEEPILRTLRVLRKGKGNVRNLTRLACQLPALVEVEIPSRAMLNAVCDASPPPLLETVQFGMRLDKKDMMRVCDHLPHLQTAELVANPKNLAKQLRDLESSGLLAQLVHLRMSSYKNRLNAVPIFDLVGAGHLESATVGFYGSTTTLFEDRAEIRGTVERGALQALTGRLPAGAALVASVHADWAPELQEFCETCNLSLRMP